MPRVLERRDRTEQAVGGERVMRQVVVWPIEAKSAICRMRFAQEGREGTSTITPVVFSP